jgi:hypothetical protein
MAGAFPYGLKGNFELDSEGIDTCFAIINGLIQRKSIGIPG